MKILYEDTIPRGYDYFSSLGEAVSYSAATVTSDDVASCDYLAVRSTTPVNEELLSNAENLHCVATATAGSNHIDKHYLEERDIVWRDAGGCNAVAVAEYVLSVLLIAHRDKKLDLSRIRVGIVGAGHVGSSLANLLGALDIAYLLNDPPRQKAGDRRHFVDFSEILSCDVISLHVPFVKEGAHKTHHLIDADVLKSLGADTLLINACRGEVINEEALLQRFDNGSAPTVVLDVFDNEPNINTGLLRHVWLATGHIAGHSIEGKLRGTQLVYEHFCELAQKPVKLDMDDFLAAPQPISFMPRDPSMEALNWDEISSLLLSIYDVTIDDKDFRNAMQAGESFSGYRKQYRVRREFNAFTIALSGVVSEGILRQLTGLGFTIETL